MTTTYTEDELDLLSQLTGEAVSSPTAKTRQAPTVRGYTPDEAVLYQELFGEKPEEYVEKRPETLWDRVASAVAKLAGIVPVFPPEDQIIGGADVKDASGLRAGALGLQGMPMPSGLESIPETAQSEQKPYIPPEIRRQPKDISLSREEKRIEETLNKMVDVDAFKLSLEKTLEREIVPKIQAHKILSPEEEKRAFEIQNAIIGRGPLIASAIATAATGGLPIAAAAWEAVTQAKNAFVSAAKKEKYDPLAVRALTELVPEDIPYEAKLGLGIAETVGTAAVFGALADKAKVGILRKTVDEFGKKLEQAGYNPNDLPPIRAEKIKEAAKGTPFETLVKLYRQVKKAVIPPKGRAAAIPAAPGQAQPSGAEATASPAAGGSSLLPAAAQTTTPLRQTTPQTVQAAQAGEIAASIPTVKPVPAAQGLLISVPEQVTVSIQAAAGVPANTQQAAVAEKAGDVVNRFPVDQLHLDPHRFQYKLGHGRLGETGSLAGVEKYDRNLAGVVTVWRDPADGNVYVVNGHNRIARAKDLGIQEHDVRFIEAANAQEARAAGALQNIAEGRGTAIDAAKFFRDSKMTPERAKEYGLPMTEAKVAKGLALANLAEDIFTKVATGELEEGIGVVIGQLLPDKGDQRQMMDLLKGRKLTVGVVREIAEMAKSAPRVTETTVDLFGQTEEEKSLLVQKAKIAAQINAKLSSDRLLFKKVATEKAAERLAAAGNIIDPVTNERVAKEAAVIQSVFNALKNSELAGVLNRAAQEVYHGEKTVQQAVEAIFPDIRKAVHSAIGRAAETVDSGLAQAPGDQAGAGIAGAGQAGTEKRIEPGPAEQLPETAVEKPAGAEQEAAKPAAIEEASKEPAEAKEKGSGFTLTPPDQASPKLEYKTGEMFDLPYKHPPGKIQPEVPQEYGKLEMQKQAEEAAREKEQLKLDEIEKSTVVQYDGGPSREVMEAVKEEAYAIAVKFEDFYKRRDPNLTRDDVAQELMRMYFLSNEKHAYAPVGKQAGTFREWIGGLADKKILNIISRQFGEAEQAVRKAEVEADEYLLDRALVRPSEKRTPKQIKELLESDKEVAIMQRINRTAVARGGKIGDAEAVREAREELGSKLSGLTDADVAKALKAADAVELKDVRQIFGEYVFDFKQVYDEYGAGPEGIAAIRQRMKNGGVDLTEYSDADISRFLFEASAIDDIDFAMYAGIPAKGFKALARKIRQEFGWLMADEGKLPKEIYRRLLQSSGEKAAKLFEGRELVLSELYGRLKRMPTSAILEVEKALTGQIAIDSLPGDIAPVVKRIRNLIDGLSWELVAYADIPKSTRDIIRANIGKYMIRQYLAHNSKPGKFVPDRTLEEAAIDHVLTKYPEMSREDARGYLQSLAMGETLYDYGRAGKSITVNQARLMELQDIDKPIRDYLGEIRPTENTPPEEAARMLAWRALKTIADLSEMTANAKMLADISHLPYFRSRPVAEGGFIHRLPDNPAFGPLRGKYVQKRTLEALRELTETEKRDWVIRFIETCVSLFKQSKTIFSLPTTMVQWLGNPVFQFVAGVTPLDIPKHGYRALMMLTSKDPKWRAIRIDAIKHGVLNTSMFGTEIQGGGVDVALRRLIEKRGVWHTLRMLAEMPTEKAGWFYNVSDTWSKALIYSKMLDKHKGNAAKAAEEAMQYMPDYAHLPPLIREMLHGPLFLVAAPIGAFGSFTYNVTYRIPRNILRQAKKGNWGPLIRLGAIGAAFLCAREALRKASGISDEEMQVLDELQRTYRRGGTVFYYREGFDKTKPVMGIDMGYVVPIVGDWTKLINGIIKGDWQAIAEQFNTGQSPAVHALVLAVNGQDIYTGEQVVKPYDASSKINALRQVLKMAVPASSPIPREVFEGTLQGSHFRRLQAALHGESDKYGRVQAVEREVIGFLTNVKMWQVYPHLLLLWNVNELRKHVETEKADMTTWLKNNMHADAGLIRQKLASYEKNLRSFEERAKKLQRQERVVRRLVSREELAQMSRAVKEQGRRLNEALREAYQLRQMEGVIPAE